MKLKIFLSLLPVLFVMCVISSCQEEDYNIDSEYLNAEGSTKLIKRKCNTVEHMQLLLNDPAYKSKHDKLLIAFEKLNERPFLKSHCTEPVIVPLAIHYQGVSNPDVNCLQNLAIDQINQLNLDYTGHNADMNSWNGQASSHFPGISNGEMCVNFVIADKNHPAGYGLQDGNLAITINRTQGDQVNDWAGYINVFVQFNTGYLGYAPLGGLGNGDGVVIDAVGFGAGSGCGGVSPQAPYNLGRTLTHEMGHYLLLDHIWGNGCSVDDEVSDTPDQASDYSGCPGLGASSCGSTDMHMNYMDYTDDACMYMFTNGQSSRMSNYLQASLAGITSNISNVYSGSSGGSGGDSGGGAGAEVCEAPTTSSVKIRNNVSVRVNWESVVEATRYQIIYRLKGTTAWTRKATSRSYIVLNGLAQKEYEYRLRSRCPSGWTSWASKQTFSLNSGGGTSSSTYKIKVKLDDYGSETSWELYDNFDRLLKSGGPYGDGLAGVAKVTNVSLATGCYEIDLFDAYGDGICCDYGNGKLEMLDSSNTVIANSDGRFGYYELIQICIENGNARIIKQERDTKILSRGKMSK